MKKYITLNIIKTIITLVKFYLKKVRNMMIIARVFQTKNGQLLVTIPKGSGIRKGDYVKIIKIEE